MFLCAHSLLRYRLPAVSIEVTYKKFPLICSQFTSVSATSVLETLYQSVFCGEFIEQTLLELHLTIFSYLRISIVTNCHFLVRLPCLDSLACSDPNLILRQWVIPNTLSLEIGHSHSWDLLSSPNVTISSKYPTLLIYAQKLASCIVAY
jgi:hypothetical protein